VRDLRLGPNRKEETARRTGSLREKRRGTAFVLPGGIRMLRESFDGLTEKVTDLGEGNRIREREGG